ncbi:fungal-specific transcription factor domain-containing protein [Colletotrichum godetiae]|uniref:Fungal-specific transcription factor domain-containing protein n=1 Tax=Colletotrichum godetiae TaxID=1209918 RepID=A0AAJ0ADG4_9PEZI|nr:fungal-specific transcription factor domain-containing protein [Colletotrichum godetiae]KAK1671802.1 fungal-specific transcription factor domain-containing protein [Colletotrichum godetiae]
MSPEHIRSNIHRFRVRQTSPSSSALPPPSSGPISPALTGQSPTAIPSAANISASVAASASAAAAASSSISASSPKVARDIPACDRCRSFKKKCSRTFPICTLCANAGHKCSFSTPAASTAAQTHHLRARIEWLSRFINENLPVAGAPGVETLDTGTDIASVLGSSPAATTTTTASNRGEPRDTFAVHQQPLGTSGSILFDQRSLAVNVESELSSSRGNDHMRALLQPAPEPGRILGIESLRDGEGFTSSSLPRDAIARRFVDAYFRNVNRAYPFVNRTKVLRDLESLGESSKRRRDADSTLLYLIMAIGCTTLQRAGQIPNDTASKFDVAYADIIQECLVREDLESIQILVLVALYSLFDPKGISTWSIAGIVSRQAMLLGLSRRSSEDKNLSAMDIELRHRLFWSIYVLDRMMAISLGLPVALIDENVDVPLPGLTIEEFASPDRQHFASILQTNRHVIQLRQLEDRILKQIHTRKQSEVAALSQADRRAIVQNIRSEIENWYSNGCLVSPLEPDNVPIHNSVTWLSARYYHLLLLLHYPCHFNSCGSIVSAVELLRFAQKHLQSTSVLLQQRQLPLNRVTLCRLFPVGLVLIHSFIACAAECTSFSARDEVAVIVSILEAFPEGWNQARQAAQVFRQFMGLISGVPNNGYTTLHFPGNNNVYGGGGGGGGQFSSRESYQAMVRPLITRLVALMQEVLGRSTCYAFHEFPDDCGGQPSAPAGFRGQTAFSPTGPTRHSAAMGNDESAMDYGWGSLELGFL